MLVDQPTGSPSRKIWAVIIAGVVVSVARSLMQTYAPDVPTEVLDQAGPYIQAAVMALAGYMTRDRA